MINLGRCCLGAEDGRARGPSAQQFRPALSAFAGMTKRAQLTKLLVEGDWAAMYYDCELPAPIGTITMANELNAERQRRCHPASSYPSNRHR